MMLRFALRAAGLDERLQNAHHSSVSIRLTFHCLRSRSAKDQALGSVDTYLSHRMVAARVMMAR